MPFFLKILAAPDNKSVGVKIPLQEGQNVTGRVSPPCDVVLEGVKVSKRHCTFLVSKNSLSVTDTHSSNGVFVNGAKVSSTKLKERDRLVIGDYILEVTVK